MDTPSPTKSTPRSITFLAGRALSALPDGLTACACLIVWIAPRALADDAVATLMLMMVLEFILIHFGAFLNTWVLKADIPRTKRVVSLLGMSLFYLIFVAAFAFSFHAWWPLWVFLWLIVGKIVWLILNPRTLATEGARQMSTWVFSVVAYLCAVFAGLMLPLPRFGLDAATVASLHLSGTGEWVSHPHIVVASATFYYSALAVFKARGGSMNIQTVTTT